MRSTGETDIKKAKAKRDEYILPRLAARYLREKGCVSKEIQKHFNDCGITTVKPGTGQGTGTRAVVELGISATPSSASAAKPRCGQN